MWTVENRSRYERKGLRYPTDLSDEEWALVEPQVPSGKWLEFAGGVISGLFKQPGPALSPAEITP